MTAKAHALAPAKYHDVGGHWPFVLTDTLIGYLGLGHKGRHVFVERGKILGDLTNDFLTIRPGYASDGASPHICTIGKVRIGTPSHKRIAAAWFVHDFLYQFGELQCCPWTYSQADKILYQLMRQNGSILAAPYYAAVSTLGGLHRKLTAKPSTTIACLVCNRP